MGRLLVFPLGLSSSQAFRGRVPRLNALHEARNKSEHFLDVRVYVPRDECTDLKGKGEIVKEIDQASAKVDALISLWTERHYHK